MASRASKRGRWIWVLAKRLGVGDCSKDRRATFLTFLCSKMLALGVCATSVTLDGESSTEGPRSGGGDTQISRGCNTHCSHSTFQCGTLRRSLPP